MWIKICANTNLHDTLLASEFGADAVGFVFAPSTRRVTAEQVRAITRELPQELEKIGVFQSNSAEEIAAAARLAGLTGVQLHNAFDAGLSTRLARLLPDEIKLIHTAHWPVDRAAAEGLACVQEELRSIATQTPGGRVLIDSKMGTSASGGTGVPFAWADAVDLFGGHRLQGQAAPMILAGGLNPNNVAHAIAVLHPWGIDVASGVESTPGSKDAEKLKAFIQNARSAV